MKASLVYGALYDGDLVVLPQQLAEEVADDYAQIARVRTYRDAREAKFKHLQLPNVLDEGDYPDQPPGDDEPYDPMAMALSNPELEWPPQAYTLALYALPETVLRLGSISDGMAAVPSFSVEPDREGTVITAIRGLGYRIERDDELVAKVDLCRSSPRCGESKAIRIPPWTPAVLETDDASTRAIRYADERIAAEVRSLECSSQDLADGCITATLPPATPVSEVTLQPSEELRRLGGPGTRSRLTGFRVPVGVSGAPVVR